MYTAIFFLILLGGVLFCIFDLTSTLTKKHRNILRFQSKSKMTFTKIDNSTTPPLRFQYSAKDLPCVFSIEREFPLMFSIFRAIAPLRFQFININVSYKK